MPRKVYRSRLAIVFVVLALAVFAGVKFVSYAHPVTEETAVSVKSHSTASTSVAEMGESLAGNSGVAAPDAAAATILAPGGVAIIGYNTRNPGAADGSTTSVSDTISFALLTPITTGTQIFFTDRSWNGSSFTSATGDGTFTYTAGADQTAGTIITITTAQLNAAAMNLDETGETIYAYQGSINTPTTFLYAADIADANTTFNGSLASTGLSIAAGTAVAIAGNNGSYGDRGHNTQRSDLLAAISSPANWTSDDNSLQLAISGNLLSAPDQQVWAAIAGDAGLLRISRDGVDTGSQQLALFQAFGSSPATFLNHPNEIVFDTVHGLFFVADSDTGNRRILQGNISDLFNPGVQPPVSALYSDQTAGTTHGQINGLAIDIEAASGTGNLYFVNQGSFEKITYAWNGASALNQTPSLLAQLPAGSFANEIALDINNHRAFVMSTATNTQAVAANPGDPGAQFDPDCSCWFVIGTATTNNELWQVTGLDRTDTTTAQTSFAKLTIPAGFTDPDGGSSTGDFNDHFGVLESIDVDPIPNFLYFTTAQLNNGVGGATGGIFRYNLTSGAIDTLYTEGNATDFLFKYIHVDTPSGKYFVSNNSFDDVTGANTSTIMVHALSAGTPTLFNATPISNSAVPWGLTVDNAPILTGSNLTPTYTETAGANSVIGTRVIAANAFTASDADTTFQTHQLGGAQVRVSSGFLAGATHQDTLSIGGSTSGTVAGTNISFSYGSADGVLTLSGADTFAHYQAALATVQFSVSGDDPTAYGTDQSRILSYSVTDGLMYSDEINATVAVVGVNDNPVNGVPAAQTFNEDVTRVFSAANSNAVTVFDVDADPAAQALQVTLTVLHGTLTLSGTTGLSFTAGDGTSDVTMTFTGTANAINTALSGLSYAPIADYNGSDTLTLTTSDQGSTGTGGPLGDVDTINFTITPVADIANDTLTFAEDSGTHTLTMPNNDTFENPNRAITAITQPAHGSVAINNNGTPASNTDDFVVYTQTPDYNGADSFTYTVTSGGVTETATVSVNITAVADVANDTLATNEDTPITANVITGTNGATADTFEGSPAITAVTNGTKGAVTFLADGTVTYTPTADLNGADSFTYTVTSGGVTEVGTVTINITPVNDVPSFTKGPNKTVLEDAGAQTFGTWATAITAGAANESGQTLNFIVSNDNNPLFSSQPAIAANGTLTFTPTANANGSTTVTVSLHDNGGTANSGVDTSATQTFTINVTSVNDAPSFTKGPDQTALAGSGAKSVSNWATNLSAGPSNESTQVLHFNVTGNTNSGLFSIQPTIDTSGQLTYTPATSVSGSATLTVTIQDDGGTLNGGFDTSASQTFVVNVTNSATWSGAISADWNTAGNWTLGSVPIASNSVSIPSAGVTNQPNLSTTDVTVANLTLSAGDSLTISGNHTLTINGNLAMNGNNIDATAGLLVIGQGGTITRTSGVIIGPLQKNFSGGAIAEGFADPNSADAVAAIFTFPVGTAAGYFPVDVTPTGGSTGSLTVQSFDNPTGTMAGLTAATTLGRYWTLTGGSGIIADVKFSYGPINAAPPPGTKVNGNEANYKPQFVVGGVAQSFADNCAPGTSCVDQTNHFIFVPNRTTFAGNWTASELAPTAAQVGVSGRVLSADGQALRGVRVTLDDGTGHPMTMVTNAFGYYRFDEVQSGGSYLLNATARGYIFTPRVVSVTDSLTDVDLMALP
jgi:hypothetical protein